MTPAEAQQMATAMFVAQVAFGDDAVLKPETAVEVVRAALATPEGLRPGRWWWDEVLQKAEQLIRALEFVDSHPTR